MSFFQVISFYDFCPVILYSKHLKDVNKRRGRKGRGTRRKGRRGERERSHRQEISSRDLDVAGRRRRSVFHTFFWEGREGEGKVRIPPPCPKSDRGGGVTKQI